MSAEHWYNIQNIDSLDTPAMVVYPDRVRENLKILIGSIADVRQLRPHIKTHKSAEVTAMMLESGITKFKCATIAEAEMLGHAGAPDVLLAYQPVGPKAERLASVVKKFPKTKWSCLVDNIETARHISAVFERAGQSIDAYIDLNVGMNRTGVLTPEGLKLFRQSEGLKGIRIVG